MPTPAEIRAELDRRKRAASAPVQAPAPVASVSNADAIRAELARRKSVAPAPTPQPDATPWGDGQAFDDMYARKPQTDPTLSPLRPEARTLTAGQPMRMKPPPAPRGPVMSPKQIRATQPERDEARRERIAREERALFNAASPGLAFRDTGAQGTVELNTDGGDIGRGVMASPIHAQRALVGAAEATLNTPADLASVAAVPFAMGFDPASQGIVANLEFARDEASVADAMDRFGQRYEQGGFRNMQEKIDAGPRFDFSAAKIPVPKELESFSGALAEGFMQYLAARGALGKFMPGGKTMSQFAKDVGATGIGYSGSSPRAADMLDPESMGMMSEYVRWLKTQPGDSQGIGRFKNMAEDATINLLAMGLLRGGQATTNALTPQALTPTNAGGATLRQPAPQMPPVAPATAATQPQQPPVAPTAPQTVTAPPVPPTPPNAPAATAGSPQPIQPASAVSSLGEAEVWYNALPQKTREAILRTMSSSGVRDKADQFAIIADLNSLPPGRNSQNAFLISQKWGERYPSLRENLLNMGGEFSSTNPRANDQKVLGVFGKGREDRAQALMDTEGRKQVVSERGFLERSAETNFGKPSAEVAQQLKDELSGLGKRYTTLLDPTRKRQFRDPTKIAGLQEAESNLKSYLKQPWIIDNMPEAVRNRLMVDASKEIRDLGWSAEDLKEMAGPSRDILAPLFEASGPLPWSPKMWEAIAEQYPRFAAHVLQSSYAKTARDLSRSINAADNVGTIGQLGRMRGMDENGNVIPGGLLDQLQKTMPNSDFSPTGAGSYADVRVNYGDVKGAQEALKELENFKAAAQRGENVADIIEKMDSFSPRQKEAALSQITAFVQDSMGAKVRNITPGQVGTAAETAPNLTQLGNDNFLAALRKVFGDQGDALANDIELARSSTTFNTDMNRRIGPNTQLKQENVRNAPRAYENPAGLEGNVVDSTVQTLGSAGLGAAFFPGGQGTAALLASLAAAKGVWNAYKKGKRLNNTERSLLADFFFRSREAGIDGEALLARAGDAPPRSPNLPSPLGYAANVAVGAGAGGVAGGMAGNGDPNAIMSGALAGAVGGGARAGQRAAKAKSSIIKPRPMPRNAPGRPPAGPRPLPGQQSNSAAFIGSGLASGGIAGGATYAATGDEDLALKVGIGTGIAGGVLGNRLAKGSTPKPPKGQAPKPAGASAPTPARQVEQTTMQSEPFTSKAGDGMMHYEERPFWWADDSLDVSMDFVPDRDLTQGEVKDLFLKMYDRVKAHAASEGRSVYSANGMSPSHKSLYAQALKTLPAPEGYTVMMRPDSDTIYFIRNDMAANLPEGAPRNLSPVQSAIPKPPPVKNGFGGKSLPMDEPSRMQRAREQGFDVDTPLYHGTPDSRGVWADGFKTPKEKFGQADPDRVYFFAEDQRTASTYADDRRAFDYQNATAETIPVYLRMQNPKVIQWNGRPFRGREKDGSGFAIRDYIDQARAEGHDGVIIRNVIDTYDGKGKPSTIRAVFDPANIRSVNAKFDPSETQSSKLLAGVSGQPEAIGAGLGTVAGGTLNLTDANGDGVIDDADRMLNAAGGAITGGVMGRSARAIGNRLGRAGVPKGPKGAAPKITEQERRISQTINEKRSRGTSDESISKHLAEIGINISPERIEHFARMTPRDGSGPIKGNVSKLRPKGPPRGRTPEQGTFGGRPKGPPTGNRLAKPNPAQSALPPRLATDLNKSKVSPATRATLDQNAALPPGERKSVMEATGWSDEILRIAAPYIRPGSRMESEIGNRIARLVEEANANPIEYALRQTMAKGAFDEAQKRFKQASGARSRAETNLERLRARNMLNPNQPATQQQLTVHKHRRDDAEQFLSEAARLRDEAKVMLDRADVELMSLEQVRAFANKEIQRITDALGGQRPKSAATAMLPAYNPLGPAKVGGAASILPPKPPGGRPSKQAADELAHLLFEQDMADKFAKIQSGEITPTQRNTFQQVMNWYARHPMAAAASVVGAGVSAVGYAALATDQGERAVQARENARKRTGQPEPELPGPPAWDWEKLSRNPRFAGDTQAALQALGYKIGRIDNNIRRADGKRTESEKALYHFLWTMDNTRDPEAPPTEAEWDALKEAALQARRKR